jgi:WS/DGAT/MGAT family acyltransferase
MKPLGAIDALWLYLETADTPMHVGALHLLDAPAGGDFYLRVRRHLAARLATSPVFTRRLRPLPLALANPLWIDGRVDMSHHLKRVRLPAPGSLRELEAAVARLHAQRLDRRRPLWQFFLIEGLADGGYALYSKLHHAAIDGAAGVVLAQALLDAEPDIGASEQAAEGDAPTAEPAPGTVKLLAAALAHNGRAGLDLLQQAPALARAAVGALSGAGSGVLAAWARHFGLAPETVFNHTIDGRRSIATASLPLAPLRAIAAAREATVNDVLLAIVGGALRTYLAERDALPDKPLLAAMPVSLRPSGDRQMNTQATMAQANLATDIADPLERLRIIHDAAAAAKAMSRGLQPAFGLSLPSLGLPWLIGAAATLWGGGLAERLPRLANLVVSNVPGPPMPLYIAGARLRTWWPLSIVEHGLGLNITVMRYTESLDIGLVAAQRLVPDAAPLAQALHAAFDQLAAAALPPPKRRRTAAKPRGADRTGATHARAPRSRRREAG